MLVAVLAFAVIRPRGLPEAVAAVPAAIILLATGAISQSAARAEAASLAPVVGFLAAVLVLAQMCADAGLFAAAGALIARRGAGSGPRLLRLVFVVASLTTAVLSLDATVVLLTPAVLAAARLARIRAKPAAYACTHLANTASLLLPVSNLTNLLAFGVAGLTFLHFAALMALPWLVAIAVEYAVFRAFFARDLVTPVVPAQAAVSSPPATPAEPPARVPPSVLVVLGLTLGGFAVASLVGVDPAWVAFAGAAALALRGRWRGQTTFARIVRTANVPFLAFVLALGIVVRAVVDNGLARAVGDILPVGSSLGALAVLAVIAAALANVINNLPAVLVLLPLVAGHGSGPLLAVLLGVNIGPNLTYVGSLATLLWRRVLHAHATTPRLAEFTRLGLVSVPLTLAGAVVALWAGLSWLGG